MTTPVCLASVSTGHGSRSSFPACLESELSPLSFSKHGATLVNQSICFSLSLPSCFPFFDISPPSLSTLGTLCCVVDDLFFPPTSHLITATFLRTRLENAYYAAVPDFHYGWLQSSAAAFFQWSLTVISGVRSLACAALCSLCEFLW